MIKLDGAGLARERLQQLRQACTTLSPRPMLAIVSVGSDPASAIYIQKKLQLATQAGFHTQHHPLEATCSALQLHETLQQCSANASVHGILLQLPLPPHLSATDALYFIDSEKDVDGLHPLNMGRLMMGKPLVLPCTPRGILSLLDHYHLSIQGQRVAIFGRSLIVGLPLSLAMMQRGATVTVCHRGTLDPLDIIATADIVVSATGQLDVFPAHALKPGCILIDVGIHRTPSGVRGDLDRSSLPSHLKAYTPVPLGIGPMTVISLLENLLTLYQHAQNRSALSISDTI